MRWMNPNLSNLLAQTDRHVGSNRLARDPDVGADLQATLFTSAWIWERPTPFWLCWMKITNRLLAPISLPRSRAMDWWLILSARWICCAG